MKQDLRLDGPRIYLRAPRRRDFRQWSHLREASRAHLTPWEPSWSPDANSYSDWRLRLSTWRKAWRTGKGYAFLVFAQDTDEVLGGVALTNVRRGAAQSAMLGYWLGFDALGHGYMSEAVSLVCTWAVGDLGLFRVEAGIVAENDRSRAVLERCGFEKEGLAKSYLQIAGRRRDHVLYAFVRPH